MSQATKVLEEISREDPGQLPRYQSERSGSFLQRITTEDNLRMYRSKTTPVAARLGLAAVYVDALGQAFKIYLTAFLKKAVADSEIIELSGALFRMSALMVELTEESLPTLDKNDPTYETRIAGLTQMKRGFASVVAGGVQTLTERDSYRTSELVRFTGYMKATVPVIMRAMTEPSRLELRVRLDKLVDDPAMKDLQPGLGELAALVRDAAKQPPVNQP